MEETISSILPKKPENDSLFKYVRAKGGGAEVKESVINAAISLKLAMNLYAEKKNENRGENE